MNGLLKAFLILVAVAALVVGGLRLYFGGGAPYTDLTSAPAISEAGLETVLEHPDPIGSVAVSADGRVFFTAHPGSRANGPRVFEWRGGRAEPFPAAETQRALFATPMGLAIDRQNRLWVIDPASQGFGRPRLSAIDLGSGLVVHDHVFPRETAPRGAYLHDLRIDPSGRIVYIADGSFWRRAPAIVVYDSATRVSRRLLEKHPSVRAQDWVIRTPVREMRYLAGLVPLKPALKGIALDPAGQWLYFGAMTHDTLYRVPTSALLDARFSAGEVAERVEPLGRKPLSNGLSVDQLGNVFITDVEHGAVLRMSSGGQLSTVVKSPRIRWAQDLSFGSNGWLYVSDSALPETLLASRSRIEDRGPYHVFRFQPGTSGIPGQ